MRETLSTALAFALLGVLLLSPVLSKDHSFQLLADGRINGVELPAGSYKLKLNGDNEAEIWHKRKMVAKSKVEVKPLSGALPGTVLMTKDGLVKEIRLKDQLIVITS